MSDERSKQLGERMRGLFLAPRGSAARGERGAPVEMAPGCPFGAVVEERQRQLEEAVREIKGRINGLIFLVVAAVVVEVVVRLLG